MKKIVNKLRYTLLLGIIALAALGNSLNAATLDVCNNTNTNAYVPLYGLYFDDNYQLSQMIYPSSLLTNMVGGRIKSLTFYSASASNLSNLTGGKFTIKVGMTSTSQYGQTPTRITSGMVTVASDKVLSQCVSGANVVINFDTEFTYTGGNLVIEYNSTQLGSGYKSLNFYGSSSSAYQYASYYARSTSTSSPTGGTRQTFLPHVTFGYEEQAAHDLGIALSAPATTVAGNTVTLTATVTNNGTNAESGYTVTFRDGNNNVIDTQTGGSLAAGASATFTTTYTTTAAQAGQTVNFTANVNCNGDGDASNDNATASTLVITLPPPENVVATAGENQTATVTWDLPIIATSPATLTWDFEEQSDLAEFTTIDSDGDGFNWSWHYNTGSGNYTVHTGNGVAYSESYSNDAGAALSPDNWMISPEVTLGGTLTFWAAHQASYPEKFAIYICEGPYSDVSSFTKVYGDITTTNSMTKHSIDLSQYSGQGYFAIRHYNVSDQFILLIDDITLEYPAGNYPISYNVYLDGTLVGNVSSSDPRSYTFNNLSSGTHQCAVSAVYNEGESAQVPATIPTFEPVTNGTVSPSSADFGTKNIGGSYTATVTVTNTGNQSFTPTIDATGLPQGISVSPTTGSALAPNGTLDLTVTFEPTAETNYSGTFTVTIPVPDDNDIVVTVTVTGSGYYASKLISNETEEIPVFKSEAQAMDAIAYQVSDIDGDTKHLLPTGSEDGDVSIQVVGNSDITRYDLNRQSGGTSWSVVAVANHSGNDYTQQGHNDNTVTVANGATEWMNLIDDAGISSAEATYVPVTHALSIQQNDNTYGAPRQTKVNTDMSAAVQSIVMSSDYAGEQTWTEDGKIYTHYTILLDINQLIIPTSDTDPTKDYDLYKVRAWRKVDPSLLNERYYAASTGNSGKNRQERLTEDGEFLFEELGYDEYSLVSVTNTNNKYYLGDNTDLESFYPSWTSRGTNEVMATFGAQKLRENEDETGVIEELSMVFTVRAYYTRTANLESNEEPTRDGESAADGKYYILEYELPLTLHAYDDEVVTAVGSILADRQVVDVTYVNAVGMQSSEPFDGMNIVVTRYNDGSVSTVKIIK